MASRGIRFRKRAVRLRMDVSKLMGRDGMAGMQICVWVMCSYTVRATPCLSCKVFRLVAFYSFFCGAIQWGFFVAYISSQQRRGKQNVGQTTRVGPKSGGPVWGGTIGRGLDTDPSRRGGKIGVLWNFPTQTRPAGPGCVSGPLFQDVGFRNFPARRTTCDIGCLGGRR